MSREPLVAVLLVAALALTACSRSGGPPASRSSTAPTSRPSPASTAVATGVRVVAEVNDAPILESELEAKVSGRLARLRQEEYEIRREGIDEIVAERLLDAEAARRRISREELLRREIDGKLAPAPAKEVEALYQANKERFSGSKEQALARIRENLGRRGRAERQQAFERELRANARIAVRLEPPRTRFDVPADAPVKGPASAPVTIVEFADYQCPYCHRAQGVMDQILSTYPGKVRLVHLDFPLEGHPGAIPAARAARCAGEQGKFWEYHRDLMLSSGMLDDADLRARATRLRLQAVAFDACLASGRFEQVIRDAFDQGVLLGVTGTPAYFVNGRLIAGARPFEDFAQVIDAEIQGANRR